MKHSLASLRFCVLWGCMTVWGAENIELPPDHAERMTKGLKLFETQVRGLLTTECLKCHGGEKTKGGFDLSSREMLVKGGDEGMAVLPFQSGKSRLLKLVRHQEEPHMPDKKPALAPEKIQYLAEWIDAGAPYDKPLLDKGAAPPSGIVAQEDKNWWSFKPLGKVQPPKASPGTHPIDAFLLAKAKGMTFAPPAEKQVLIRRASLDLTGLPPAPGDVTTFETKRGQDAWPRLVRRLLSSEHYGECWARHWLDVARFAESSGFEHDYDRPGAYQYRDFVIRALNSDLPFDQFLRWQLAGDEFEPENPLALAATGFLGAGVFPTQITANEVERTRYDALDDMLSTTSLAFMGLTVGCARCHDHKYDPIPTKDYYRMLSTFTTTVRSVLDLDFEPERTAARKAEWKTKEAVLKRELEKAAEQLRPKLAAWIKEGGRLQAGGWSLVELTNVHSNAGATFRPLPDGSVLAEGKNGDKDEYTIRFTAPGQPIAALRLEALADNSMTKGGPGRADNGNFALSRIRISRSKRTNQETEEIGLQNPRADFEQNNATLSIKASLDEDPKSGWAVDPQFGKRHAAAFDLAVPITLAEGETLTVKLSFEVNRKHNLGRFRLGLSANPGAALEAEGWPLKITHLASTRNPVEFTDAEREVLFEFWKKQQPEWREQTALIEAHAKKEPDGKQKTLVCAEGYTPLRYHTQGADFFNETYQLKRGSTDLKNGVAEFGFLQVLNRSPDQKQDWRWAPPPGAKYSGRRRSMANWLLDTESGAGALVARVAVNRVWQHHFGRGIVSTPNDFGHTGSPPSHPELLDWLAGELIRGGWQLKPIHELIMTSAAYQQACMSDPRKEERDPENQLFMRRTPRRLDGENIRDSILEISGQLDSTMYGPGTKSEKSKRRSVYFTIKRSELVGSMVVFDQPEPLVSQGQRPTTTVAPQALLLMNGPQVRQWAEMMSQSLLAAEQTDHARVRAAYRRALSRYPSLEESKLAEAFLENQRATYREDKAEKAPLLALADFCQVLFGLNDFAYEN